MEPSGRKRNETLSQVTPRVADAMDYMPVGMVITDLDGRFLKANPSYCALVGRPESELLGRTVTHITHPDHRAQGDDAADQILAGKCVVASFEKRYVRPDGSSAWALMSASLLRDAEGHPLGIVGVVQDLSRTKAAEDGLRRAVDETSADLDAQRVFLHQVLDLVPHFIFAKDRQGRYTLVNRAVAGIFGASVDKVLGRTDADFNSNQEEVEQFRRVDLEVMDGKRERHVPEEAITDATGEVHWVETFKRPILDADGACNHVLGVAVDITERKRLEMRIRRAQKLESLGVLAGGIAHDFNNLLVGILGNAGLARMQEGDKLQETLAAIEIAARRAADLTHQLLAYSGRSKIRVAAIDVSRLADEMLSLLKTASISKKAEIRCALSDRLPAVRGDATQLRQVVLNLVTNASESLEGGSGHIDVRTGTAAVSRQELAATYVDDALPAGEYVFLEVADTGCGMDEATKGRIFDPFFTTKFAGRGLGLASVLGIVRGHRGALTVESAPGGGTAVRILLPAHRGAAPLDGDPGDPDWVGGWRGQGRVLVVDDEETVRNVARSSLEHFGFEVETAGDGEEAVRLFEQDRFDAVLLDATMPRVGGAEALRAIRRMRPDAKVILTSGYSERDASSGSAPSAFLEKPYTPEQLVSKLRQVLRA